MSDPAIYSRAATALWRRVGDEVLVAEPGTPGVQRLSQPASVAWLHLEDPHTAHELTEALAAEYSAPAEEIAGHVAHLLDVLRESGWVTRKVEDV